MGIRSYEADRNHEVRGGASSLDRLVKRISAIMLIMALCGGGITFYFYCVTFTGPFTNDHATWGQFGDFWGGTLNPYFSLLSLFALLITLWIQSRELSLSTEALKDQSHSLNIQAFENTFFSMVGICNDNIKSIDISDEEPGNFTGKMAFRKIYDKLKLIYSTERKKNPAMPEEELLRQAYNIFIKTNEKHIGVFLRTLKQTLDFVEERACEKKESYWNIVRSQLSAYELVVILYHSEVCENFIDRRQFIVKRFFEDLDDNLLLNPSLHLQLMR